MTLSDVCTVMDVTWGDTRRDVAYPRHAPRTDRIAVLPSVHLPIALLGKFLPGQRLISSASSLLRSFGSGCDGCLHRMGGSRLFFDRDGMEVDRSYPESILSKSGTIEGRSNSDAALKWRQWDIFWTYYCSLRLLRPQIRCFTSYSISSSTNWACSWSFKCRRMLHYCALAQRVSNLYEVTTIPSWSASTPILHHEPRLLHISTFHTWWT